MNIKRSFSKSVILQQAATQEADNTFPKAETEWYQLDLTRVRDLSSPEPSRVGSSGIWLARVDITSTPNLIANFVANSTCIAGTCALCLRVAKDVGTNGPNNGLSLYTVGNEGVQCSANPVTCYSAVYQESDCLDSTSSSLNL